MEVRATTKDFVKFKKVNTLTVDITEDKSLDISIVMVDNGKGELVEWTRGRTNILSFLKYGYVRIIKNCPHRIGKCIGEKCSFFVVKNGTGDCAHVWATLQK